MNFITDLIQLVDVAQQNPTGALIVLGLLIACGWLEVAAGWLAAVAGWLAYVLRRP